MNIHNAYITTHEDIATRDTEIASLRAEIGRLREALVLARPYVAWQVDTTNTAHAELAVIDAALTPPSQAPEARRDVGGEKE